MSLNKPGAAIWTNGGCSSGCLSMRETHPNAALRRVSCSSRPEGRSFNKVGAALINALPAFVGSCAKRHNAAHDQIAALVVWVRWAQVVVRAMRRGALLFYAVSAHAHVARCTVSYRHWLLRSWRCSQKVLPCLLLPRLLAPVRPASCAQLYAVRGRCMTNWL